jgi:hypothetical protein
MSTFNAPAPPTPAASPETGKKRASRISLDYFKHRTFLDHWKRILSLVLFFAAALYLVYVLAGDHKAVSRGPVADVHAAWDNNCQACHEDFSGVRFQRLWGGRVDHKTVDAKCEVCHSGAVHHASMKPESVASCGGCHRDHRGREASLVRLPDADCTSCHSDLKAHMKEDPSYRGKGQDHGHALNITSFASGHPEFQLPKKDPGNIKFNHSLHMIPGQTIGWKLDDIKNKAHQPELAAHYKADGEGLVVLECSSCHVLDPGDGLNRGPGKHPLRPAGAYMQPITYANNCQACHSMPLDIKTQVKSGDKGAVEWAPVMVPHYLQPPAVDDFLWGAYANAYLKNEKNAQFRADLEAALKSRHLPTSPLPGKRVEQAIKDIQGSIDEAKGTLFYNQKSQAQNLFRTSCLKCHSYDDEKAPTRVLESNIPMIWQPHAHFNHASHRALECRDCHEKAYPFNANDKTLKPENLRSVSKDDVMLPDIKNCRQCHSPPRQENDKQLGGVRHDCTECHSYHHGSKPLEGLGAAARNPSTLMKSEDFLRIGKK